MPALALDIGTYTIKALAGNPGKVPAISRAAEVFNTTGLAVPLDDAGVEKLATLVQALISDNDLPRSDVRLSVPETVVSTKVIAIPPLTDAELASAISWQAEQHIPIPPEELVLEYEVLYRPPKSEKEPMRVLLIGLRRIVVDRFVQMFHTLGIEPSLIETQMLSIIRSLQFEANDPTTLIAHMGASNMNLSVMHQGELKFVLSHLNGGQLLTKALEQTLSLDTTQSEQYKRTYGLDDAQFQGKVREALLPAVRLLVGEMKKAMQFFSNQNPQAAIARVVLSGGTAMLPGIVQFVTSELGVEVLVSAPFAAASGSIPQTINQPSMAVCMGLLNRTT